LIVNSKFRCHSFYRKGDFGGIFPATGRTGSGAAFCRNRSQVQGSTFRVEGKEDIKDPKSSLKVLISPNNCHFGSKFWIRPDETDAFLVNTHPECSQRTRMQPLAQTWHVKIW
jgi:hypothetical protein